MSEELEGQQEFNQRLLPMIPQGAPWWVQTGLIIMFWLGPASLVGVVFLSMWSGWLPSPITENQKILTRLETKFDTAITRMSSETDNRHRNDENVVRLLLATCRNVAKNEFDKSQCDGYWRR
jgi:hypothetical protein